MSDILQRLIDDLDDIASLRLGAFAQAHEAEQLACRVLQLESVPHVEEVCGVVEAWWNKHRPPTPERPIAADMHTRLALVERIKYFARGGS